MKDVTIALESREDALTVATLLVKAGYRVQMRKSKEGTAKYMYVLEIAR